MSDTSPIKTSADKIVEKYRPHAITRYTGELLEPFSSFHAIHCAILEVEECCDILARFSHLNATLRDVEDYNQSLLQELKSRIV